MEDAFKRYRETHSSADLLAIIDRLRGNRRSSDAVEIVRDWIQSTDLNAWHIDDLGCIGQRLCFMGAPDEAIMLLEKVVAARSPNYQSWLLELAIAHCIRDDFATGFSLWREALSQDLIHDFFKTRAPASWQAVPKEHFADARTDLSGKSIRILWDAAFGDAIQNVRYIDHLRRDGVTKIYMEMLDAFVPLMAANYPDVQHTPFNQPLEETGSDYAIVSQNIFLRYADSIQSSPVTFPYLRTGQASDHLKPASNAIHQRTGKLKVALFWRSTNVGNRLEPYRSMGLSDCLPLLRLPDIDFFSCLHGELSSEELFYLRQHKVTHIGQHIHDMHDLACVLKEMDLVISVCSGPIHLAGALSIPVYGLISALADWRWGRSRNTSFLYPSLRLFRQQALSDWRPPVMQIAQLLSSLGLSNSS